MFSAALVSALGSVLYWLLFLVGIYVYVSLIRQISVRSVPMVDESARTFGLPEAIAATVLIFWLLLNVYASVKFTTTDLGTRDLVANLVLTVVLLLILAGFLKLRGFDLDGLAGFSKVGIVRAVSTGALLLLVAYPLLLVVEAITQQLIGHGSSTQSIVELFNKSRTIGQRIMIIILAVAVAPVAEEFVFRFFLYGVFRRYFGRLVGVLTNSVLFAAVHAHLPSFAPLLVLGTCFTLAYEWSGSILVSMAMHSLFNSLTLIVLAFPELFQQ